MLTIRMKKLIPEATLPVKAHATDAAFDVFTTVAHTLQPGERYTFSTGVAAEFPPDYVALFRDRSSLGSKGIQVLAGVIDASYRGDWKVVLLNTSEEPFVVQAGDRIAQCLFLPVPTVEIHLVETLSETSRGEGGFGSSGR